MDDRAGNEARCQVPNHTRDGVCPEHFSYCSHEYEGVCGQPLVQDGACQTCESMGFYEFFNNHTGERDENPCPDCPPACPVHGVPATKEGE